MEVFARGTYPVPAPPSAVSVGVYDGVHLGHRHVLSRLVERARAEGLVPVVVTFDPHPVFVVAPERARPMLTTLSRRLELLADAGVERTVVVGFDEAVAAETPGEFVERVLVEELAARAVVVGEDFRFGHGRAGDVALLGELAGRGGYDVVPVPLDRRLGEVVSSSRIRDALERGDVAGAAALLGRPHELEGIVVRGDGRGRALGYPTANLEVHQGLAVPAVGIYAGVWARPSGAAAPAAISVGRRPTFYEHADVLVEAYLLDVEADLYGERGHLSFVERLRGEERFSRVEDLVDQIGHDVAATRARLAEAPRTGAPGAGC